MPQMSILMLILPQSYKFENYLQTQYGDYIDVRLGYLILAVVAVTAFALGRWSARWRVVDAVQKDEGRQVS